MSNKGDLTVVMYHYVRDLKKSRYPLIKGLDLHLFKEQLDYLQKHYVFVTMEEVIAAFHDGEKLPSKAVLLTFDDAYLDHFTNVFPLLEQRKIQGSFYPPVKAITEHTVLDVNKIHFIIASIALENISVLLNDIKLLMLEYAVQYNLKPFDYYYSKLAVANRFDNKDIIFMKRLLQVELVEELRNMLTDRLFNKYVSKDESSFSRELYMSVDQIKCMLDCGMHIGSHGYDHYWLGSLDKKKQQFEIQKSVEFIKNIGGDTDNWSICYPYGSYNEDTISVLEENGCKIGFTTVTDLALVGRDKNEVYKIPRLDTNDIPKLAKEEVNTWFFKAK